MGCLLFLCGGTLRKGMLSGLRLRRGGGCMTAPQMRKRILKKTLQVKYYIKGRDLFVSFTFNNELPNHAYILSPHGVQLVGTPDIIDDSFTEITEKL